MSKPNTEPAKPELFKVKLAKPHTHEEQDKKPGDSIMVSAPEREFLRKAGVIEPETETAAVAAQ